MILDFLTTVANHFYELWQQMPEKLEPKLPVDSSQLISNQLVSTKIHVTNHVKFAVEIEQAVPNVVPNTELKLTQQPSLVDFLANDVSAHEIALLIHYLNYSF